MNSLPDFYQYIPEHVNPIVVSVGSFSIKWYSVMYLVAFVTVYFLLSYRIRKKENLFAIDKNQLAGLLIYLIIGLLVGARLGYALFYNFGYFLSNPLEIFWPFRNSFYSGLAGMSYFGGLVGVLLAGLIFSRKLYLRGSTSLGYFGRERSNLLNNFWRLADFVIPAVPAGYFFGRIGNFLNGELYGRVTDVPWGMYFPADSPGFLRHPSQLYEAFFEGLVLFLILWLLRNKSKFPGQLLCLYLFGYGFFRFFIEFFREPDEQIGFVFGILTLGQIFSLILIVFSFFLWHNIRRMSRQNT